jgi:hypothetical protein
MAGRQIRHRGTAVTSAVVTEGAAPEPRHAPVPEISGLNIVVVGAVNPAILQPAWFGAKGLLRPEEAEAADVEIITRELVSFSAEWLGLTATLDRLQVSTTSAPSHDLLRDLVVGVFQVLPETPLTALGINHNLHFRVETQEAWHAFGHKLAPKEIWNDILDKPGTRSLIIQGVRPDDYQGSVIVQVEPSVRIQDGVGIYIGINDHFQLDAMDKGTGEDMRQVLEDAWEPAGERSRTVVERILKEL